MQKRAAGIFFSTSMAIVLALFAYAFLYKTQTAHAASVYSVNATGDADDATPGDDICKTTTPGECTLRAAITEANANPGADTINFSISGTGVHTLQPASPYPDITEQVTINGYSQPGSTANTAVSPNPFNGTLTIEIDGSNIALNGGTCLTIGDHDDTAIKGLVINRCGNSGIAVINANFVEIKGNYIGTDTTGLLARPNGRNYTTSSIAYGIRGEASNHASIGCTAAADRNVIAANQAGDIFWGNESNQANPAGDNIYRGNYIGLGADGTTALPSGYALGLGNAILLGNSHNDIIGGTTSGAKNVIATSSEYGIGTRDGVTGLLIQGNYVGTDYTGTTALSHSLGTGHPGTGIHIGTVSSLFSRKVHDITIGGTAAGAGNVVSGNTQLGNYVAGIGINDGSYNVTVQGNFVGTDVTGTAAVPNYIGVALSENSTTYDVHDVTVGGSASGAGNIISGNDSYGVDISGLGAYNNTFKGNYIGVDASGTAALGNGSVGLRIASGAHNQTIGGSDSGTGNIIADSVFQGIFIQGTGTSDNVVQGNLIGVGVDGVTPLTNDSQGIAISGGATDNLIGGTAVGAGNTIRSNVFDGVIVTDTGTVRNSIIGNSLYDNDGLGIALEFDGSTANDANDADSGANDLLNYPANVTYQEGGGNTDLSYTLDVPAGDYRIEFYENTVADPSGHGEGETFLDSQDITSTGTGPQSFSYTLSGTGYTNLSMTATEIDPGVSFGFGSTSEFSGAATQTFPPTPVSDLSITKTLNNPLDYQAGGSPSYTVTITNEGSDAIDLASFDGSGDPLLTNLFVDLLPPDQTFAGTTTSDVACTDAPPGAAGGSGFFANHADYGFVFCAFTGGSTMLADGDSFSVDFTTQLANDSDLSKANYVIAYPTEADPDQPSLAVCSQYSDIATCLLENPINNFAYSGAPTAMSVSKVLANPQDAYPGGALHYTLTITNNGSGDIDLANYNTLLAHLVGDLYPADQLTYTGTSDTDVTCADLGPGSYAVLGASASSHATYQYLICRYIGASQVIGTGQSFSVDLNFTATNNLQPEFTNYASHTTTAADATVAGFFSQVGTATDDILDTLTDPHFARTVNQRVAVPSSGGNNSGDEGSSGSVGTLSPTGQNQLILLAAAFLLIIGGWVVYVYRKSRR